MKTRFYLMTALICLLLASWIWLEQQHELARQEKYTQLSQLPVYVYVSDSTKVATLMERLSEFPQINSLSLETGLQAADELVSAYQLPVGEEDLLQYRFPSIITFHFAANQKSLKERPAVMRIFAQLQIELSDIDAQSNAWKQLEDEIHNLWVRWLGYTVIYALMLALLFYFVRLGHELHYLLLQKRKLISVADALRMKAQNQGSTLLMTAIPLLASIGGYFILHLLQIIPTLIPLWWFAIPVLSLVAAALAVSIQLNKYYQDLDELSDPEISHEA